MKLSRLIRTAVAAGCVAVSAWVPIPANAAQNDPSTLLEQADGIKSSDHARFVELLRRLDADPAALSLVQQDQLHYFHGWESAYQNDSDGAIQAMRAVAAHAIDPNLRVRATGSLINVLANATRYEEAYELQYGLIAALPGIRDRQARLHILSNAALLYATAGQSNLALHYANALLADADGDLTACQAQYYRMLIFSKMRGNDFETNYPAALARCVKANEPIWTNSIRVFSAERDLDQGHPDAANAVLEPHLAEARKTGYTDLVVEMEASLGRAAWMQGNKPTARALALRVASADTNTYALTIAYRVLYEIGKSEGDAAAALTWYEKYATMDKGYLNDISARALAYQMVSQQVQQKKQQVTALDKENQVLQLKQQVDKKNAETGKLLLVLLLTVLGSIALYAYRTKRSQLKFMNLARRDGLTGISNRQHFIEASGGILAYAAKSLRDVCVIVIDLDHFKEVNDAHGHATGDAVLKLAVAACQAHLRSLDVFGRLGGEEFGILIPDCVPERAADIAEQMRKAIADLCKMKDNAIDFPVNASFGVSATRSSGYDLRQLLIHADSALYRAKREGRNCVAIHDDKGEAAKMLPSGGLDRRRS